MTAVLHLHCLHRVQRCGLLLPMSVHGLCMLVSVCVGHTREPYKIDEPIEMPFEIWTRVDPGNHVLGGDPDRAGESDNSVDMPR